MTRRKHNVVLLPEMEIDLVPLSQFSERISEGWRMVPGYPLQPGDYVVTMCAPGFPKPVKNLTAGWRSRELMKRSRVGA